MDNDLRDLRGGITGVDIIVALFRGFLLAPQRLLHQQLAAQLLITLETGHLAQLHHHGFAGLTAFSNGADGVLRQLVGVFDNEIGNTLFRVGKGHGTQFG